MHRDERQSADARVERFNDQEIFVEVFENVRGEDMYVIQPTSSPNDNLMELSWSCAAPVLGQPDCRDPLFRLCPPTAAPRPARRSPPLVANLIAGRG